MPGRNAVKSSQEIRFLLRQKLTCERLFDTLGSRAKQRKVLFHYTSQIPRAGNSIDIEMIGMVNGIIEVF